MEFLLLMFFVMTVGFVITRIHRSAQITGRQQQTPPLMQPPSAPMAPHGPASLFGFAQAPQPPMPHRVMTPMMVPPQGGQPAYPLTPTARQACDDDITTFGTELRDLDLDVVGRALDADANQDYTRALDAYDAAKQHLARAHYDVDARRVAEILEEGRFAMACVRARVNGQPLPAKRPPCFFDPAHGPSSRNITWAPLGGSPREVPACEADAQRVQVGAHPDVRMVPSGQGMVPYWENRDYAPWAQGYYRSYGNDPAVSGLLTGAMMVGGFGLLMGLLDDIG